MLYYSGSNDSRNRNSVPVLIRNVIVGSVPQFIPCSDGVVLLRIKTNYCTLNLIQIYAPRVDKDEDEIEEFFNKS